jgi:methyl-accepting chemotaxis protein
MKNWKIGVRLAVAFGVVTTLAGVIGLLAFMALSLVDSKWNDMSTVSMQKREIAAQSEARLGQAVQAFKNYVLRGQRYDKAFSTDLDEIGAAVAAYRKHPHGPQESAALDEIGTGITAYRSAMQKMVAMRQQGASVEAIDQSVSGADKAISKAIQDLTRISLGESSAAGASVEATVRQANRTILSITLAVVLSSILSAWLVTRSIVVPVRHAVQVAQTVAGGDLTSAIEVHATDETGRLLEALRTMQSSLVGIVGEVRGGTDTIAAASRQIASGNQDLSSRTEEQASSLEQTAASMEELTSTVKQNADNARQANQLAVSASEVAVRGGSVVNQVVDTMSAINTSSKKIVDIIAVIDGIAFQTNILALNAAVEAARAGEQGRGFAVVASEVRSLAQRSAAAAKEIKTLIDDSVNKVGAGSAQVAEAGRTMEEIVASVRRVTDIMGEISAASQEQTSGIDQINQAITQMDQVTQQNAALVEEAAAAASSLQNQAGSLVETVSVFRLERGRAQPWVAGAGLAVA